MLYDVDLYQMTHRGHAGDVRFYGRVCEGASSILELGCGWGRVMMPLLEAGYQVTGLDLHAGMIEALRSRLLEASEEVQARASLIEADMGDFSLGERFERVLVPYNGLYVLLSEEAQRRCLERIFEHLQPGGELWLDVYLIDDEEDLEDFSNDAEDAREKEDDVAEEGVYALEGGQVVTFEPIASMYEEDQQIDIFEGRRWDAEAQRLDAVYVYQIERDGQQEEKRYTIPQRYLRAEQLLQMLEDVGFVVGHRYGDFRGNAWEEGDETLIVQGIRSA